VLSKAGVEDYLAGGRFPSLGLDAGFAARLGAKKERIAEARRPKGKRRPDDAIGNAVLVMKIATGEVEGKLDAQKPTKAARVLINELRLFS
jgi:hypothetical protein